MDCRHVLFLLLSQFERINRLLTPPFEKSSGNPRLAQGQLANLTNEKQMNGLRPQFVDPFSSSDARMLLFNTNLSACKLIIDSKFCKKE